MYTYLLLDFFYFEITLVLQQSLKNTKNSHTPSIQMLQMPASLHSTFAYTVCISRFALMFSYSLPLSYLSVCSSSSFPLSFLHLPVCPSVYPATYSPAHMSILPCNHLQVHAQRYVFFK